MELLYRTVPICVNFSFSFLKKVIRDWRWPTAPLFIMNISPPFGEFVAPLHHILPIYNITINSNNLFVNVCWTFTFCVQKPYDWTHLAFGGIWIGAAISNVSHSKPVLPLPNEHGSQVKRQGQQQCCHTKHKKFPCQPTHDVSLLSGYALYYSHVTITQDVMHERLAKQCLLSNSYLRTALHSV
jgi:hypothetical protein